LLSQNLNTYLTTIIYGGFYDNIDINMKKTKMIVQAGLFVAIYAIFFLMSSYLGGGLESILYFILPLPLIIFTVDYGYKYAVIPFIATILIGLAVNIVSTLLYVISSNILGIVYGELVRRNKKTKFLIFSCIIAEFISTILSSYLFASLIGYSLNDEILEIFTFMFNLLRVNINDATILNRLVYASIPVYLFVISVVQGYCCHLFATIILKKLKIRDSGVGNIYLVSFSKSSGFIYIISFILHLSTAYFLYTTENTLLLIISIILTDFFWIMVMLLSFQTIVTGTLYFARIPKLRFMYLLIIGLIMFMPLPILLIYSIIGLVIVFNDIHKYLLYNNK